MKWLWRIVREEQALWFEVLNFRYGLGNSGFLNNSNSRPVQSSSTCWRDLCSVEVGSQVPLGWFKAGLFKKVGEGKDTRFWIDPWLGSVCLKNKFPRLFSISVNQDAKVVEVGRLLEMEPSMEKEIFRLGGWYRIGTGGAACKS